MRFTKYDLSIAILKVYAESGNKSRNKFNVLGGRAGYPGNIESVLQTEFAPEERALAGQVFNDLESRGYILPTYEDTVSPGSWLKITSLGERALEAGVLDDLDHLLVNLHSPYDLLPMRYGAYEAMASHHTDWERHVATSCRELITKVLYTISPDQDVKNDSAFILDSSSKSGITRKERIRHYLRLKHGKTSKADRDIVEKSCELIEACYVKLSTITHTDGTNVNNIVKLTEDALFFLLN